MKNFLLKLTSRKFLAALAGLITGAAIAFGAGADTIDAVSGAVMASVSLVTYIITEGRVDAMKAADAIEKIQHSLDAVSGEKNEK